MSDQQATGGCLCGGVRFSIEGLPEKVSVCHCEMCRRWTGSPMMAIHPEKPTRIDKGDTLTWYVSSEWAERGFCSTCGTSLFYRLQATPEDLIPSAGAMDDPTRFTGIKNEIFVDEQPDFYRLAGDAPRLTGPEVIAMFMAENEEESA